MKTLLSLFVLSFATVALAASTIHNWKSTELTEAEAVKAVFAGTENFLAGQSCNADRIFGLEAINHLVDAHGNPAIVVYATVQASGVNCGLDQYLDCSTSFHRINGEWTYISTTCEPEEVVE